MQRIPKAASAERQAVLLKAATRVSKSVATILDPDELLRHTVDIICDEFGFYYAGVFLLDETGQWAVLRAGRGAAGAAMMAEGHKLAVGGNSMIGAATGRREARIALDVGDEAVHFKNPHLPHTRSEMALPLVTKDNVLGALTVQSEAEAAFSQADIDTLQGMADQLAIAIENSRLHRRNRTLLRQAERRARLLAASADVGRQVTSILDLDELLPRMVEIIVEAYGFYYAGVFLLDETGEWAVLRAGYGEAGAAMLAAGHKLAVGGNSMIGAATRLGEARIALDVGSERVFFKNPHLPHTRSEMALPLMVGPLVLGAVTVQSVEEAAFSEDDIQMLQTMADHLAVAINNALTLKALERANAELLRTKTYEALATATTEAIHWIGNKALPITTTVARMQRDLAGGEIDREDLKEDLDMIDQSARLIVAVKEALIGAAREHMPRPTLVQDVAVMAATLTGVPRLTLTGDPALVWADSTQLTRALGNLLQNAVEAGAQNVEVAVGPAPASSYTEIVVRDDGAGIAPEVLPKVWAAFYSTKGPSHNGLGLSACLHVISQLGGSISIESSPGVGTAVRMLLPTAVDRSTGGEALTGKQVALVGAASPWLDWLQATASDVMVAVQPPDAPGEGYDLWLVDEALGVEQVLVVLAALKQAGALDKTLVVTSALNVERATRYLNRGVHDVRLKPYTVEELTALIG